MARNLIRHFSLKSLMKQLSHCVRNLLNKNMLSLSSEQLFSTLTDSHIHYSPDRQLTLSVTLSCVVHLILLMHEFTVY